MNWFILIIAMFVSAIFGFFVAAICVASSEGDKRIKKILNIGETTEEIIEIACQYAYVEDCRSEGDYDINVDKEGTRKIREILEGIL